MIIKTINYGGKNIDMNMFESHEIVSNTISNLSMFYEIDFLKHIQYTYAVQTGIIDIGANIGNHSLFFSEFLEYDIIHSFEPYADNFELLQKNMDGRKAKLYQTALSDKKGEMVLYNSELNNNGGFSLHPQPHSFVVYDKIDVTTLDSYKLKNISMIKIDVEGHEEEVLKGAVDTIKKNHPIIFVENLGHGYPELFKVDRLDSFFNQIGYIKKEENITRSLMDLWVYSDIK
jgi:FkbM family methyltransferase